IGGVGIGGSNPIRVQSMITCDTMDTAASIAQTIELAGAGCEIVRITAPTVKDAANLQHIVRGLRERGCDVPIVAEIHSKPEAAIEAAKWVDKVRINTGNYADSKKFKIIEYTDEQYAAELTRIRQRFTPLVELCKQRGIAMRIGTNHGSLSDRIMNRYGDTPLGMVESALEFARIARDLDYHSFIFSMKSSNPKIMIAAYRLLVARLKEEKLSFDPFSYQRRPTDKLEREGVRLGGDELVRVVIRKAQHEKIAHKIDRMGDYKPEIIFENARVMEVDPRDDEAIARVNDSAEAQLVTVKDDVDLPLIPAFRLLAVKLQSRHPILLKDGLSL